MVKLINLLLNLRKGSSMEILMIVGFGMMVVMQFMTIRSMRAMQKTLSDVPDKGMRGEFNSLITEMRELLSDVPDKGMSCLLYTSPSPRD